MKQNLLILITITLLAMTSCQPGANYKIAYVNLQKVYQQNIEIQKADSILKLEDKIIANYIQGIEARMPVIPKEEQQKVLQAYNDTIEAYKQKVQSNYQAVINAQNNNIQEIIDSVAKQAEYDYVLSTEGRNILFVKDTTNDISNLVIESLKH